MQNINSAISYRTMLLTTSLVLSLFFSVAESYAQAPTLSSIMNRFNKEPGCSGATWMGVKFTIIMQEPNSIFYSAGIGEASDLCLERKQSFKLKNQAAGLPYHEFEGSGTLNNGTFTLKLGQLPALIAGQPSSMGSLRVTFRNGTVKDLTLPGSLSISADGRFIYGELDNGKAVISILIRDCGVEGCAP